MPEEPWFQPRRGGEGERPPTEWLLLIHQIPPKPPYFRVKIWRRLQRLGAIVLKSSVYVLPLSAQHAEALEALRADILRGAGDASICRARFSDQSTSMEIRAAFNVARNEDYRRLGARAQRLLTQCLPASSMAASRRSGLRAKLKRLRLQIEQVNSLDFCDASGRVRVTEVLSQIEHALAGIEPPDTVREVGPLERSAFHNKTWVSRRGVHIDRMASAWLIRRFIDVHARFRFISSSSRIPKNQIGFDMRDAMFSHENDGCTFEVLLSRFGLEDPALRKLAEIVHDIDLKDRKFRHIETPGVERLVAGIVLEHRQDRERLLVSAACFDSLYQVFQSPAPPERMASTD